jgi:putative membrane protein
MVAAGWGLWRPVVGPPAARRVPPAFAPLSFATAAVHSGLLGALLVFARSPWFPSAGDAGMGLAPLADQQLAGVVLWTAGAPVVLAVIWWSVTRVVLREERGWQPAGIG